MTVPFVSLCRVPGRFARWFLLLVVLWGVSSAAEGGAASAEAAVPGPEALAPNRPALSRPIADQKLVIAHYMTGMLFAPGAEAHQWMDPDLFDPAGRTAKLGGVYQTVPIPMLLHPELLPPIEAALLEMRTAKALGVDGFNFYYPFGPDDAFRDRYDRIILSFFEAARRQDLDFKLTLCLAPYGGLEMTTEQKIRELGRRLGGLVERTGGEHWLRTPDGRLLVYTWLADAIVNEDLGGRHWEIRQRPELLRKAAWAYDRIAEVAGVEAAFLYHLDQPQDPAFVERALDYFPAVTGWVAVGDELDTWRRVARQCADRGRTYVQEVHSDFYGSKVYEAGTWNLLFDLGRAVELGVEGVERHAQVVGLSRTFREKLELAIELDSPLINLTTWNDYPEGHHLAPEVNHNFGFAVLLRHYLARWRGPAGDEPEDVVIVFFKKYPAAAVPEPFDVPIRYKRTIGSPEADDGIEVVTILREPARLEVAGHAARPVPAGLAVTRLPMRPGSVHAAVVRDGAVATEVTTPEWITSSPYRTDRLTYSFSSAFEALYRQLYGGVAPRYTSTQYREDASGVPGWQRGAAVGSP